MRNTPSIPGRHLRWLVGLCCLIALGLSAPADLWGRAGGGGGYSGGGGGYSGGSSSYSSSSYGGSGGGGEIPNVKLSPRTTAILLSIIGVVVLLKGYEVYREVNDPSYVEGGGTQTSPPLPDQVLSEIQAVDPSFDADAFREDFKGAFVAVQEAWMGQDMAPVKHFVTDGISEKFSVQFRQQRMQGYREQLDRIKVRQVQLARFESNGLFDMLSVQVDASLVDQRVSAETGKHISGGSSPEAFTEYWSFVRRRGAQSDHKRGSLLAGACPNCGSPVVLNQYGHCQSCEGLVRGGSYDWVLSEITQASEWRDSVPAAVVAAAETYRQRHDRSFSAQQVEDRASVIFARKELADSSGQLDALREMATPAFCESYRGHTEARFRGDISIGSLDLLGIVADEEAHFALLEVRWSGRLFARAKGGDISAGEDWRRSRSLMVLSRRPGVQSNVDTALQSAHCPSCGAAEEDLTVDACPFCSAVTNTGQYDWVLAEFGLHRSGKSRKWRQRLASAQKSAAAEVPVWGLAGAGSEKQNRSQLSRSECLMWAIGVWAQDGELDPQERQAIEQLAGKNQIRPQLVEGWISEALAAELERPETSDPHVATTWLKQMIDVLLADGRVVPAERALLSQLADNLKLSSDELGLMIRKQSSGHAGESR